MFWAGSKVKWESPTSQGWFSTVRFSFFLQLPKKNRVASAREIRRVPVNTPFFLRGGNSNMCFTPIIREMIHFDEHILQMG